MNPTSSLKHIAIIPDGNRRWAKQHGVGSEQLIYKHGTEQLFDILETALNEGVEYLTIWVSSYSNLTNRTKGLVGALEKVYSTKFEELLTHPIITDFDVRVEAIGEWRSLLQQSTIDIIDHTVEATKHHTKRVLTILIGYDGRHERGAAVQFLLASNPTLPQDIQAGEALLRKHAWTGNLPDVDLIIRTGSADDPHNSAAFLSLIANESQYSFPDILWPDFDGEILHHIIDNFTQRQRRLGA